MNLKITVSLNGVVLRRIKLSHILVNTVTDRGYASAYAEDHQIYNIYVVVNFLSQVIFIFLLFLGMLMYANEV